MTFTVSPLSPQEFLSGAYLLCCGLNIRSTSLLIVLYLFFSTMAAN